MTQQFKFGDMVKSRMHPNKTLGLVVDAGSNQYSYIIRWEHTKGVSQEHTESLELIPHPDTVRLDWLARNDATITDAWLFYDEDGNDIGEKAAVFRFYSEDLAELDAYVTVGSDIRQAIDTAMREKAA